MLFLSLVRCWLQQSFGQAFSPRLTSHWLLLSPTHIRRTLTPSSIWLLGIPSAAISTLWGLAPLYMFLSLSLSLSLSTYFQESPLHFYLLRPSLHPFFVTPTSAIKHKGLSDAHSRSLSLSLLKRIANATPWSSLVEGDEGLHLPNCQTNLVIALHTLSLLLWHFINTTWADTSLLFINTTWAVPLAAALPGYTAYLRIPSIKLAHSGPNALKKANFYSFPSPWQNCFAQFPSLFDWHQKMPSFGRQRSLYSMLWDGPKSSPALFTFLPCAS